MFGKKPNRSVTFSPDVVTVVAAADVVAAPLEPEELSLPQAAAASTTARASGRRRRADMGPPEHCRLKRSSFRSMAELRQTRHPSYSPRRCPPSGSTAATAPPPSRCVLVTSRPRSCPNWAWWAPPCGGEDHELVVLRGRCPGRRPAGHTGGLPLLHPWANRLARRRYVAAGVAVDLRGLDLPTDDNGLPMHGTMVGRPGWEVDQRHGPPGPGPSSPPASTTAPTPSCSPPSRSPTSWRSPPA